MADNDAQFRRFFCEATSFSPHRWQVKVAIEGLPEILPIPTGLGKTEGSVLAWAWRRFARKADEPLHLIYCLPMRSLVRQTVERLRGYFAQLKKWNEVIDIPVHLLIGGDADEADPDKTWAAAPDSPWVLVGTQDMLLSRALNRGYGMSRFDWPVHFGLLNQDCHWVVDEVQLMGPGLWTTAQLDWMRRKRFRGLKPCRTTWMSATLDVQFLQTTDRKRDGCNVVEPFDPDFESDSNEALKLRRAARRPVELHQPAMGKKERPLPAEKQIEQIASEAKAAHATGTLTLIVCNTVKTAQTVFKELKTNGTQPILLTSRFRADDRSGAEETLRAFESRRSASPTGRVEGDDPGLICVSTQVVEAGLDISAYRLWTEHAPWPSLVQRLGRLNRDGKDNEARAIVWKITPENKRKHEGEDWIGPYRKIALDQASSLLKVFAPLSEQKTAVEALATLRKQMPKELDKALAIPPEPCPRALDVHGLFSTEPDLHGGFTDVSRFVRNDDPDADVIVFWRDWQGNAPPSGDALDGPALDPNAETCPVVLWRLQEFLKAIHARAWIWNDRGVGRWNPISVRDLKPGMTVMLRGDVGGYDQTLGWTGMAVDRLTDLPSPGPGHTLRDDRRAESGYWSSLASHIADSRCEAERICDALSLQDQIRTAVIEAASLDDLGKSHPDWQRAIPKGGPLDHETLAKFPPVFRVETPSGDAEKVRPSVETKLAGLRHDSRPLAFSALPNEPAADSKLIRLRWALTRKLDHDELESVRALPGIRWARHRDFRPGLQDKGMRHEAASALAMWSQYRSSNESPPYPALAVYLAAAHHGKVRTVLRSISGKGMDVFGIGLTPETLQFDGRDWPMDFSMVLDGSDGKWADDSFICVGPGWTGIVADLLGPWRGEAGAAWTGVVPRDEPRALGPFALAWLEALVRVADWRASDHPSHAVQVGGDG